MVPAPITPTRSTGIVGVSASMPGIFHTSRSAKKLYRWAADWGPVSTSTNSLRSTAIPSSNGKLTAASMHLILLSGARKPRNFRALAARNAANISGLLRAASTFSLDSRTLRSGRCSTTILAAKASAAARSSPSGASSSTRPMARQSVAGTCCPLVTISSAFCTPTIRGSRCVPPAPGSSPRLTSGRPHFALGTAMR